MFETLELGMRLHQCISGARKDTRKSLQSWKLIFRSIQICYFGLPQPKNTLFRVQDYVEKQGKKTHPTENLRKIFAQKKLQKF